MPTIFLVLTIFGKQRSMGGQIRGGRDGFHVRAPEQIAGTAHHPTQDVWAGATLALLMGRPPFEVPDGITG